VEIHGGTDLKNAERFYGGLFGWGTAEMGPQYLAYDPGAGVGGVFQSHTPACQFIFYVYVEDVDASIARIEGAGGKRMGDPMEMPGMGVFGYFGDPNGVAMGLIGSGREA
jgi:predicted enzyme related to lactoylglutathione lyase